MDVTEPVVDSSEAAGPVSTIQSIINVIKSKRTFKYNLMFDFSICLPQVRPVPDKIRLLMMYLRRGSPRDSMIQEFLFCNPVELLNLLVNIKV